MYNSLSSQRIVTCWSKGRSFLPALAHCKAISSQCVNTYSRRCILKKQQLHHAKTFQRQMSAFEIEKEQLKSFIKYLYAANIDLDWVFPFPTLENSQDLHDFSTSLTPLHDFLKDKEINSAKLDQDADIPKDLIEELKSLRLFGLKIPQEYDGLGLTNLKMAKILEDVASADISVNMMIASHNLLGVQPILKFGSDEQKSKYLPLLASGEKIAAFCVTEARAGSDMNMIEARARLSDDGKHWILSGEKMSINNGAIADLFIVFAKMEVTDVDDMKKDTIAAFIVEKDFGGIYNGPQEDKMGMRALNTCDIMFDETSIPLENMLGEERDGFKIATETLNEARLGLVSGIIGPLRAVLRDVTAYADARVQFGKRIKDFELVKERISRMAENLYAMESVAYLTHGKYDQAIEEDKIPDMTVESAVAKVFCAQKAAKIMDDCIELIGHRAYTKTLPYERMARDVKMLSLTEGTADVLKLYIALSCFKHAQNYLERKIKRLKYGSLRQVVQYILDDFRDKYGAQYVHQGFLRKRIPSFGVTDRSHTKQWLDRRLKESGENFEKTVLGFYRKVFRHARFFGNNLNNEQLRLRRFADLSISMYAMIAVLARCNKSMILGLRDCDREYLLATSYIYRSFRECELMSEELQSEHGRSLDRSAIRVSKELVEERRYAIAHPLELEHRFIDNPIYLKHFDHVLKSLPK